MMGGPGTASSPVYVSTVLLVFIGLPMFFFGLAVMQTQER